MQPEQVDLNQYDAVIFDLGGVILQLDYLATIREMSLVLGRDIAPVYSQARQDPLFDQYERGEIATCDFFSGLIQRLPGPHLELLPRLQEATFLAQLDAGWNAMLLTIPDETLNFLRSLHSKIPTFLLSNTNDSHLTQFLRNYERDHLQQHGAFSDHFQRCYYSHQMGQRKPETGIYHTVLGNHGLRPERTLFIDDNLDNLAGAQSIGLHTLHHLTNHPLAPRFK